MKKLLVLIAVMIFAAETFAQNVDGKITEEFNRINVSSIADVTIITGKPQKVVVSGDVALLSKLKTEVVGGELFIGLQSNKKKTVIKDGCCDFKIEIWVEDLDMLTTSGLVKVSFPEKTVLKNLDVDCSGMTELLFDDLEVSELLTVTISGTGTADINGKFGAIEIGASGACNVSFSGEAYVMDLMASGASSVTLSGHANKFTANASGVSKITSKNFKADNRDVSFSGMSRISVAD
ncbi:MAG: DUF2807 domain-containing protein [Bacteroidales bacterium]|nr:DUF2807 domain-containing protein [Bacteroidales bacterium]